MLNFGERFGEEEIEEMVKQADTDDDGIIDFTEFVCMITHMVNSWPKADFVNKNQASDQENDKEV